MKTQARLLLAVLSVAILLVAGACALVLYRSTRGIDCARLPGQWSKFIAEDKSLSFCYADSWGAPTLSGSEVALSCRRGDVRYISFARSIGNSPLISYSTLDYALTCDRDAGPADIDWQKLGSASTEKELKDNVFFGSVTDVVKTKVNGLSVIKARLDYLDPLSEERVRSVGYFLPGIDIAGKKYNLHISGLPEQETSLDLLLSTMRR
ncbi:MAG: hypothetical protein V1763_02700 [Parcubacteria group bacterium]